MNGLVWKFARAQHRVTVLQMRASLIAAYGTFNPGCGRQRMWFPSSKAAYLKTQKKMARAVMVLGLRATAMAVAMTDHTANNIKRG